MAASRISNQSPADLSLLGIDRKEPLAVKTAPSPCSARVTEVNVKAIWRPLPERLAHSLTQKKTFVSRAQFLADPDIKPV